MVLRVCALVGVLALGGCSSTPNDLEAKADSRSQTYSENYQEIYRRVAGTAKRCMASPMGKYAAMAVDTEIYSELGRGEVTVSLINYGVRNYYMSAKVERLDPKQSKLTVSAGNALGAGRMTNLVFEWASSDKAHECPLI